MSQAVEDNREKETEILKFIDSINLNEIDANIDRIYSEIEVFFKPSILIKCSELAQKKFINLNINLIKYFHKKIVENLTKFNQTDSKIINILISIYSPIVSLSDKSIEFCNYFHEVESENGIKILFDLMMNEKLLSILNEPQPNDASILERLIGSLFYAVLNISKAYESNKTKWNDLNAYQKLLDLSKKTNRKDIILKSMMILGNIASDADLKKFSTSPKGFEFLTVQIDRFSNALKDKLYLSGSL